MIDVIKQQFKPGMTTNQKLNVSREFLQFLCLKAMSDKNIFAQLAFVGGTSLRVLYDLKRFSEDLDFSVTQKKLYDFKNIERQLTRAFRLYGLPFEAKTKTAGNVHNMMMKFTGLPKELGFSELPGQKLSIKLEVDANPPQGWTLENTLVNKIYMFTIVHYDLPSLYAGKLHACFCRKFTKGRDIYDLVWYIGKKIVPNFDLLNRAIKQTETKYPGINAKNFKQTLSNYVSGIDFDLVKKDVERFLEDKAELNIFNAEIIKDAIQSVY